jgi:hypothetical protein
MNLQAMPHARTLRFLTEGPSQHHAFAFGGLALTEEELFDDATSVPAASTSSTHACDKSKLPALTDH